MARLRPITIVGGGLAGLFLGIRLRRLGVPVQVLEAGSYPRHRVCGEFIHGKGLRLLREQELVASLERYGARWARTTRFIHRRRTGRLQSLEEPALCLSRRDLDLALARTFEQEGGRLSCHVRAEEPRGDTEGVILATGRRRCIRPGGWKWLGLKCHFVDAELDADLEMHFLPDAYVGLCRLDNGKVNVCGLFRQPPTRGGTRASQNPMDMLRGPTGSLLQRRLDRASPDVESFCSVAGLDMRVYRAARSHACRIGDAVTMIPPLTGNGMSMAFESAALATEPMLAYASSQCSWNESRTVVARRIDKAFKARLRWAGCLQRLLFTTWFQRLFPPLFLHSERLWQQTLQRTR